MRKIKKDLIGLVKISLFCFAFFLLSPSTPVKAMFSDTVNQTLGIQLEFGTINLDPKETKIVDSVKFTEGEPVKIASSTLVNKGSLSAKLAYKIDVTKDDDSLLTADELKNMVISIDLGSAANNVEATATTLNSGSFTFVKSRSGSDVVIEPDSVGKVPVSVSYKSSIPTKEEKLKIRVTFRLIQSNALDANDNLFSDTSTIENIVSLVPKVVEEKSYWPDKSTFIKSNNDKITYSLEKMDMVFSEVYNPEIYPIKEIKNLNKAVLYIQLPIEEELKTTDYKTGKQIDKFKLYSTTSNGKGKVNVDKIELDEVNHGYKVTFSLLDSYDSSNPNIVREYTNKFNYQLHQTFQLYKYTFNGWDKGNYNNYADISLDKDDYASRLVLSTDIPTETNAAHFTKRIIPLSTKEKNIVFKQLKTMSGGWVENGNFKDILLNKEVVDLEVIENGNQKLVSYLIKENKTFSLWLNSQNVFSGATLNVKITGDTGNTLIISRELEMQKNAKIMEINSFIEEPLKEETKTQNNTEESQEMSTAETKNATLPVEEPTKEVVEEPVNESRKVDEADDLSSSETIIEVKENVPEVTKEDKEVITEKMNE